MIVDENTKIYVGDTKIKKIYQGNTDISPLPYTILNYIQSTGAQWIDPDLTDQTYGYKVELKWAPMSTTHNQFIYGAEGGGGAGRNYFKYSSSTGLELGADMYLPFSYSTTLDVPLVTEVNNRKNTEQYVDINGMRVYSTTSYQTTDRTTYKPYIFVMNQSGHNLEYSSIKLYYIKFYNYNDELIRDFIPVLDKNNISCLWDKVEEKFYYNAGSGQFLYG